MADAFSFEGDEVKEFLGTIPRFEVECPEAYQRGTVLRLNLEVRVRSVHLEETAKGDLVRKHIFAVEAVSVADQINPQTAREGVSPSVTT